jgi:hypothetical protein
MVPLHWLRGLGEAGAASEEFLSGNVAFCLDEAFGYGHGMKWVDLEALMFFSHVVLCLVF